MDADSLLALVRFHAWANDRILTTTAGLSDEEFRRTANLDHGSAFQTLRHLVDVDWSWREALLGNDVGDTYVWDHGFELDELPAIHAFCLEEDVRLRSYVESHDDAALAESMELEPGLREAAMADRRPRREPRNAAPQRARPLPHRVRALAG